MKRTPMNRGKGLRARSPKMAKFYREERAPLVAEVIFEAGGKCQVKLPAELGVGCLVYATTVHEILTRGRGGGIMAPGVNDKENCMAACVRCHQWITEHPIEAQALGLVKSAVVDE